MKMLGTGVVEWDYSGQRFRKKKTINDLEHNPLLMITR